VAFVVLALLSVQFFALGLVQASRDSPTYDEKYHLAGGVTALTDHQLRLTPEHPPLPKVLAALPALAANPVIPQRGRAGVEATASPTRNPCSSRPRRKACWRSSIRRCCGTCDGDVSHR
jgi:hypothetical protein